MKLLRITLALAALPLTIAALSGCGSTSATANNGPAKNGQAASPPSTAVTANTTTTTAVSPPVQQTLASTPPADPPPADPTQTATITPVAAQVPAGRIVDKTFDDIKFPMQPGETFRREMVSQQVEALAGQRIRIRGYILPTPQKRGIKQFVLVRDNQECCFGPGAALYDCVLVEMQPGHTAAFSIRPVAVEGTFGIEVIPGPDDKPLAIYHLQGEAVQ